MKSLIVISLACCLSAACLLAADAPVAAAPQVADPLVGLWHWGRPNNIVEIRADGTTSSNKGDGVWSLVSAKGPERKYKISWNGGTLIDTLTLSEQGTMLSIEHPAISKFTAQKAD